VPPEVFVNAVAESVPPEPLPLSTGAMPVPLAVVVGLLWVGHPPMPLNAVAMAAVA
jgi:hypothetical protein